MTTQKQGDPIAEKIQQLFVITGARGVGKTILAATFIPPSRIEEVIFVDSEKSSNKFRADLRESGTDFGKYIDVQKRFAGLPSDDDLLDRINRGEPPWARPGQQSALIDYYRWVVNEIAGLPRNKYSTLVVDTTEKFEAGMAAYVDANKREFGVTTTAYGKLWTEGVYPLYQNFMEGVYERGVSTIILNFHLKNVWEGNRPVPGKVAMSGKKILYTLATLMLWLVNDGRNPRGEPAALVIKERLGRTTIDPDHDEWVTQTMLPQRLPICTWPEITRYLKNGRNSANPEPTEVRSAAEDDMISEFYSDAQLALMLADARADEQRASLAMAEMGLTMPQSPVRTAVVFPGEAAIAEATTDTPGAEAAATNSKSSAPVNKADAIRLWTGMGRAVPVLLKRLRELGVGDDQIGDRWGEIVGE